MSDVDTGTGPFPTDLQAGGGGYWRKKPNSTATAVPWRMFGDGRMLYLAIQSNADLGVTHTQAPLRGFGDPIALSPSGDVWTSAISFDGSSDGNNGGGFDYNGSSSFSSGGMAMPRGISGLGGSVLVDSRAFVGTSVVSGADSTLGSAPSAVDGQVKPGRLFLKENGTNPPRAITPGVFFIPQTGVLALFVDGAIVAGGGELIGRSLMLVATNGSRNSAATGMYMVDLTGPWR